MREPLDMPEKCGASPLELTLVSDAMDVRATILKLLAKLRALNFSEADCSKVELVVAEVLNNIVEHAYPDGGRGTIRLRIDFQESALAFEVVDHGLPMPNRSLPSAHIPKLENGANLPEGGWGWMLIHELSHDLSYVRTGCENRLRFCLGYRCRP
ncbi:ATP-binding protein [Falsihalocynthiibacter sp. SS001]|uniref:ATP-binding protein n=1 Tax=Falsihalocynthiibacter sp. SS001 TaxID=3349698 RepID=UPI0036D4094D